MIGSMVEYTGAFSDFHGRRGIVIEVNDSVAFKNMPCYRVVWTPPVNFGGRFVSESTFIHQDLKFLTKTHSEVKNEGE